MTDAEREQLVLAAKAAGYKLSEGGRTDGEFIVLTNDDGDFIWRPHTDDGDVLRLAHAAGLRLDFSYRTGSDKRLGVAVWTPGDDSPFPPFWTMYGRKPDADIRSTIIRAAAHTGKNTND